jgi:stage V sporulation protein SpoVS
MVDEKNDGSSPEHEEDPTLLKVKGDPSKEYVKKLANAALQVFSKHQLVKLRGSGASCVNNAEKAFIIARGELDKKGVELVSRSYFVSIDFDGEEKTGIVKELIER